MQDTFIAVLDEVLEQVNIAWTLSQAKNRRTCKTFIIVPLTSIVSSLFLIVSSLEKSPFT